MTTRYIDTRPRAADAVFSAVVLFNDTIQLRNVCTGRTTLEDGNIFRKHYDPILW